METTAIPACSAGAAPPFYGSHEALEAPAKTHQLPLRPVLVGVGLMLVRKFDLRTHALNLIGSAGFEPCRGTLLPQPPSPRCYDDARQSARDQLREADNHHSIPHCRLIVGLP